MSLCHYSAVRTGGSKAAACAQLKVVAVSATAAGGDGTFACPDGAVLPFGTMEEAAAAMGKSSALDSLLSALEADPPPSAVRRCRLTSG